MAGVGGWLLKFLTFSQISLSPNESLLFFAFWVPIYISGSLFSVFWLHSREECQISLHVYSNELTENFDFFLCLLVVINLL